MMSKLALVRKTNVGGEIRQGQVGPCLQKLPRLLDAAPDDILVRRQPGGLPELAGEVVGAQVRHRGHLLQAQVGIELLLDVLDDSAEPPWRQCPVAPVRGLARRTCAPYGQMLPSGSVS